MRARWIICAVAIVALAGLAVLAFAPRGPFRFLSSYSPVVVYRMQPAGGADIATHITEYSFEGDLDQLLREADPELRKLGYRAAEGGSALTSVYSRPTMPGRAVGPEVVIFRRNTRVEREGSLRLFGNNPGWVSVSITGRSEPSLLDRFRNWAGI